MVRTPVFLFVFVCVSACSFRDTPEDWREWYDEGTDVAVEEPIAYTTENYDLVGETPISGLPRPGDFQTLFAPDDAPPTRLCSGWRTDDALPVTISGVVTIHPRFYIKVSGCRAAESFSVEADEKYFGSFYLQDATGGFLVLGDTKVADFSVGDRVTLNVRAVKNFFDQDMIAAHDVVEIVRGPRRGLLRARTRPTSRYSGPRIGQAHPGDGRRSYEQLRRSLPVHRSQSRHHPSSG